MRRGGFISGERESVLIFSLLHDTAWASPRLSCLEALGGLVGVCTQQILPQLCARAPMALEGRRKLHQGTSGQDSALLLECFCSLS